MDWSYIAGFFDGEGCVSLSSGKLNLVIAQCIGTNCVLQKIQGFCKLNDISAHIKGPYKSKNPNARPCERLQLSDFKSCKIFLEHVIPFLIVKRYQAEYALSYLIENRSPRVYVATALLDSAIEEYQSGESVRAVSIKYGISPCGIEYHMSKRGIQTRTRSETYKLISKIPGRRYRTEEFDRKMQAALADYNLGLGMNRAAKKNKTTLPSFRAWLKQNGIPIRSSNESVRSGWRARKHGIGR